MKVIVIFEFPSIQNPNSPEADRVVQEITNMTVEAQQDLRSEFQDAAVWVDEAREDTFTGDIGINQA